MEQRNSLDVCINLGLWGRMPWSLSKRIERIKERVNQVNQSAKESLVKIEEGDRNG